MNLTMEAADLEELNSVIAETLHLVFTDLLEENELDQYLRDRGWSSTAIPVARDVRDVTFQIPWQLIAENALGPARGTA
jgi:hypothetical protein